MKHCPYRKLCSSLDSQLPMDPFCKDEYKDCNLYRMMRNGFDFHEAVEDNQEEERLWYTHELN